MSFSFIVFSIFLCFQILCSLWVFLIFFLMPLFQFETLPNSYWCVFWQDNIPNDDNMYVNSYKKLIFGVAAVVEWNKNLIAVAQVSMETQVWSSAWQSELKNLRLPHCGLGHSFSFHMLWMQPLLNKKKKERKKDEKKKERKEKF